MNQSVLAESATQQGIEAKVHGQALQKLPEDLYIPPDALRVFLDTFEGPLDLLLYLIRKQNMDILDIPIVEITKQYMQYVEIMTELHFELAAEYLVMAAMLAEIKSRMLLPKPKSEDEEEGVDPRAELVRRLQEYERFKKAAADLDELPRVEREVFVADAMAPHMDLVKVLPSVDAREILMAFRSVLERVKLNQNHLVEREVLSVRERMTIVLSTVKADQFITFTQLFKVEEGRMGVVVTFIAILELIRQSMLELVQNEMFGPIYVKAIG